MRGAMLLCVLACSCKHAAPAPAPQKSDPVRSELEIDGTNVRVVLPAGAKPPLPAVIMLHSAFGRTPGVLESASALAKHGYAVYALDFFHGQTARDTTRARELAKDASSHSAELEHVASDAYARLATDPRVQAKQRFLLGWSFGAAWSTYLAGQLPDVSGVVAFYGEALSSNPKLYESVRAPMLLIGGTRDPGVTPDTLRAIAAKKSNAKLFFVDAAHGFCEPRHPGYDQKAADRAWSAALGFLDARH